MNTELSSVLKYTFLFSLFSFSLQAQSVVVDSISVIGNKKTKEWVVLRELSFQQGDTLDLSQMTDEIFVQNRLFLLNTGIFTDALFNIKDWDTKQNNVHIEIEVKESFYIYPIPVFELADRNFNVWWKEMNRDLSRVNIGLRLYHINLTGRRDKLKLAYQTGYTKKLELEYDLPPLNRKKTLGLTFNILRTRNQEVPYRTFENRLQFERSEDDFLYKRFRTSLDLSLRPKLFATHRAILFFHQNRIADFVKNELNPDFFGNDKTKLSYFTFTYLWEYDRRDLKAYAWNGTFASFALRKDGIGITDDRNALSATARYARYQPIKDWLGLSAIIQGRYSFIRNYQPYYDYQALGYEENYLRGYEFYVIDGLDYIYQKTSLRFKLIERVVNLGRLSPIESFREIPGALYFSINSDLGITHDPFYGAENSLSDTFLWGRGIGLDLVVYYAVLVQAEYSFNHLGEKGFFLHVEVGF